MLRTALIYKAAIFLGFCRENITAITVFHLYKKSWSGLFLDCFHQWFNLPSTFHWVIGKDLDAGKDWRQGEKGMTEDEMVGWHHWLNGHEFEQALEVGDGQGGLACCSPWFHKDLDATKQLHWTDVCESFENFKFSSVACKALYNLKNLFFNKKFKYHCDCTTQKWLHGGQALKQGNKLEGSCSCLVERFWWLGLRWSESVKRNVIRKFFMTYCGTLKKEE